MSNAVTRKLDSVMPLSAPELDYLLDLQSSMRRAAAGTELMQEGQALHEVYVVHSGWAYSYRVLDDGARQIINFHLPGDWIGLRAALNGFHDHSSTALTEARIGIVTLDRMRKLLVECPRLAAAIFWAALMDEGVTTEHLVSIGRRTAIERMGHFFVELSYRLKASPGSGEIHFKCPLTQTLLGDTLGLTAIHVNRILRRLRERKLLTFSAGTVTIHDLDALKALVSYRGNYLGVSSDSP